jgi:signal-transduction protein with cAMP-binding, CBS, and nucleotidyltransferase domain
MIQRALEDSKPMTRSRLEVKIVEIQQKLDDALERKEYKVAGPLQETLEHLQTLRMKYPSIDELRMDVKKAEMALTEASKNRDFSLAAVLQSELVVAQRRLMESIKVEEGSDDEVENLSTRMQPMMSNNDIKSRVALEDNIGSLYSQVEEAIAKKDFKMASELQSCIEELEKLREIFPSVEQLLEELQSTNEQLNAAIAEKDFENAGRLHEVVAMLEKKIEAERSKEVISPRSRNLFGPASVPGMDGNTITFESRYDLENEIVSMESLQEMEIVSKKFKRAQDIQKYIERLHGVRRLLPTVSEIDCDIKSKRCDMDRAISEKRFADAELIDKEISVLEERLGAEKNHPLAVKKAERDLQRGQSFISNRNKMKSSNISVHSAPAGNNVVLPVAKAATVCGTASHLRSDIALPSAIHPKKSDSSATDDVSDITSVNTSKSGRGRYGRFRAKQKINKLQSLEEDRAVSKLRPKKPLISSVDDSVLSVAQMLARKRGDASLIVSDEGGLAGIITDTDITRRLVARQLDASKTCVSEVMTPNPTCVSMSDSAMDAMTIMVENHFRHLPVVDDQGGVVGLLDIAKCLNDAITKLEKSQAKSTCVAQEALKQAVEAQGGQSAHATALQALLGPLMRHAFGNQSSPTLRSLLAGKPGTVVSPETNLLEAGIKMADSRKAALVVDGGKLVGIFGFKDMMTRAIAKGLPLNETKISVVMTPNPEFVAPEMTVLEALQTMHDNKFLTLPVCEDDGTVVGLVNVMDVIYGCGGAEGWRSIFRNTLELDDLSDTASHWSEKSNTAGVADKTTKLVKAGNDKRVAKLRPKKVIFSSSDATVLQVVKSMTSNRADSSILLDSHGHMNGIVTDTDIAKRVVAKKIDPAVTLIDTVMTFSPKCVSLMDFAADAMVMMIENRFRHLPVMDTDGIVVGILDIAKCLNDAISKLERSTSSKGTMADDLLKQALESTSGTNSSAIQEILRPLLSQAFGTGSNIPTLREIVGRDDFRVLTPTSTALDAAVLMADSQKAVLVVDNNELVGLFSFRDLMCRVVANELNADRTSISEVMTPDPDFAHPEMTALEALQMMHDNKFLTLPVCEGNGDIVGLVDVMDIMHACGNADHWRSLFEAAMEIDDFSDIQSAATPATKKRSPPINSSKDIPMVTSASMISGNIPATLEFQQRDNEEFDDPTLNASLRFDAGSTISDVNVVVFKIVDQRGHTHRVRSEVRILNLRNAFAEKTNIGKSKINNLRFKFVDEEGDAILISSDEDLAEAIDVARSSAPNGDNLVVKLLAEVANESLVFSEHVMLVGAAAAVIGLIGLVVTAMSKPKPTRY